MNKNKKIILTILTFICFLCNLSSAQGIEPISIIQKPTDKPKDKPIMLNTSGAKTCYIPTFRPDGGYIAILNCDDQGNKPARYDVFQRISYNINNVWVCLTAPEDVTNGKVTWDYIYLSPCSINDKNQRWIFKDNAFYTGDGQFRIKNTDWLYITKDKTDKNNHTLDSSMKDWINTIATPGNLSMITSIAWDLVTPSSMNRYYIGDNQSWDYYVNLYYNPENGHIATYDSGSGSLYCMYSEINGYDWNWVSWKECADALTKKDNPAYWDVSFTNKGGGIIKDYQGNLLRVTRYGSNWGVPYTAKPSFLKNDTNHSPTSLFVVSKDLQDWVLYTNGNLGETLEYCPAPGGKKNLLEKKIKRSLPPSFVLNDAWIKRLWEIATSADGSEEAIFICGFCLLHSYQMIAELQEYHIQGPLGAGGYFFDTAQDVNAFISFSNRFPLLRERLEALFHIEEMPLLPGESRQTRTRRLAWMASTLMLPQYNWSPSSIRTTDQEIRNLIQELFDAPIGTLWLGLSELTNQHGLGTQYHAQPLLRYGNGIVILPTNVPGFSLEQYQTFIDPYTNVQEVFHALSDLRTLLTFTAVEIGNLYENPVTRGISQRNCTGSGEDRRGSRMFPSSSLINQCTGGRCALQ
ncbi:hypothetical protein BKH42_05165 [Helicobacter sp. 13S00482-2]|uniref:DUF1561 family protein n=1 Tax=Helicobacter sp. 13S00482-2 TaxID=1476200 RepID=UPI000BA6C2D8|nr:DUF1561 family protein [Helicobacter sp. 13S00482-2]PAF53573.1 hypothetical protein BKH42_05165 [Helicobacter sp. 13S00482-2]